ncbi:hypothetical protein ABZ508_32830 [Streptomyces lavendulocolor]|uniref:Chaplin domain-containing protein n=1 Tax=Streptomyces lavendulocolor TaxID=67316 RepID=A0ABV2WFN5_9ACTN
MRTRTFTRSVGIGCTVVLGVLAGAQPASAGGILPIVGPAFGNICHNTSHAGANGTAAASASTAGGNVAQVPQDDSYQHCGGAEISTLDTVTSILGGG